MQAHGYRQEVHFDGMTEIENQVAWTWQETLIGVPTVAAAAFVTDPHTPEEPGDALQLRANGSTAD